MFQQERITQRRDIGLVAGLVQLREQLRGVAREVFAVSLGVEIDVAERELPLHAKRVGVRFQIRTQLVVGRLARGGDVIGDELHLLPQPAADDRVVLVQTRAPSPRGNRLPPAPGPGSIPPTPRWWADAARCG